LFILVTEAKTGAAAVIHENLWSRYISTGVMPHYSPHADDPICGEHHRTDELHSTLSIRKEV
jgi:hypothetical protein